MFVRKLPLLARKQMLERPLAKVNDGIAFNGYIEGEVHVMFERACKLGHEGIVTKRKDLPYESGRSRRWLKIKAPTSRACSGYETRLFKD